MGVLRKTGTIGIALTAYDMWRRLPPKHRRLLIAQARRHGPTAAKFVASRATRPKPR